MTIPALRLRPKHDRRIKAGHPWVFSNELDGGVGSLPPGGVVDVHDAGGAFLGRGYANPHSLISVRILSRQRDDIDHPAFWAHRLREARAYREAVYPDRRSLRLVHAEGDGLPGLVVDAYDGWLAVQLTTLGTDRRKEIIEQALREVFAPKGAVLRSEGRARQLEGLEDERAVWFGDPPDEVEIDEYGVTFRVPLLGGQKTGHFFDQADNRRFAGSLCHGRTVLDVYAHTAGWALHALRHGAVSATAVDKSAECVGRMRINAELNGVSDRLEILESEGKLALQQLLGRSARFGAVVLDPPAFAKTRKSAGAALRGYREINALGLSLVEPGGFLFTSSCSFHVHEDRFLEEIAQAARLAGRRLRLVRRGDQAADHPVALAVPETRYLKSFAFQVTMDR